MSLGIAQACLDPSSFLPTCRVPSFFTLGILTVIIGVINIQLEPLEHVAIADAFGQTL